MPPKLNSTSIHGKRVNQI